jgi:hypothetical protein
VAGPAVVILAGPGDAEAARVRDLLDALAHHEPAARRILVVDDEHRTRRAWPRHVSVLANPRAGRGIGTLGGTCAGTLAGLSWAHDRAGVGPAGTWVLRLDADALVVGPVAARVEAAFAQDPRAGILGVAHRTPNGEERTHPWWGPVVRRHARALWLWRRPPLRGRYATFAVPLVRDAVTTALRTPGYEPGQHAIAAGCAIRGELVAALARSGQLADPTAWLPTLFGDDVMLGVLAAGMGFELRDLPAVFGIQHRGLPDAPAGLVERGFGVVHSTKNDPQHAEDDVRAFFRERRGAGTAA